LDPARFSNSFKAASKSDFNSGEGLIDMGFRVKETGRVNKKYRQYI
jgi:hypothetical protein